MASIHTEKTILLFCCPAILLHRHHNILIPCAIQCYSGVLYFKPFYYPAPFHYPTPSQKNSQKPQFAYFSCSLHCCLRLTQPFIFSYSYHVVIHSATGHSHVCLVRPPSLPPHPVPLCDGLGTMTQGRYQNQPYHQHQPPKVREATTVIVNHATDTE